MSYEPKQSLFHCTCLRKHLILNKIYHLYVFVDALVISENEKDLSKSKYVFKFNYDQRIHWKMSDDNYQAFGILYKNQVKWFDSEHSNLKMLKEQISGKVFFGNISIFYDSISKIGSGASSIVCIVQHKSDQQKFAAKCISKKYLLQKKNNERMVIKIVVLNKQKRLYQEIQMLQFVKHPNFVELIEIYQGESSYYIITELLEGDTLYKFIKGYPADVLPIKMIKQIMKQILEGLAYLDDLGIIHRDIKMENIMLKKQGSINSVKIIDFGLAIFENQKHKLAVCGTPGYIAPEVLRSEDLSYQNNCIYFSSKCDIFSAGVIFYKLLTKKSLFRSQNTNEILELNKQCKLNVESEIDQNAYGYEVFNLLKILLADDPSQRPSAKEALQHNLFRDQSESFYEKVSITISKKNDELYDETNQWSMGIESKAAKIPNITTFQYLKSFIDKKCISSRMIYSNWFYKNYFPSFDQLEVLEQQQQPVIQDHILEQFHEGDDNNKSLNQLLN